MACPRRDALRGRDGAVQMWRRGRRRRDAVATAGRWRFPSLQHIPDRLGFLLVGQRATNFGPLATDAPTSSFYMCAARRGPTSLPRAGRPRSGRESRPVWSVGPKRWRSTLTLATHITGITVLVAISKVRARRRSPAGGRPP